MLGNKKMEGFLIIIFDKEYRKELLAHNERMMKEGTISANYPSLYLVTDSIEEAINYIKEKSIGAFKLQYVKAPKLFWGFLKKD